MRVLAFAVLFATACGSQPNANGPQPAVNSKPSAAVLPVYTYEIVKSYPHDPKAFTQGLLFHGGFLFESTGQERRSSVRKVELDTGKVVAKHDVPSEIFAEGLTFLNDRLYQITWRDGVAYEYDANDLKLLREMSYLGEGWGLANDGTNLIMSDGTHMLKFVDPQSFKTVRSLPVMQPNGKPLFLLNELEWVNGEIWANIWHSEETETGTTQGRMPNIGRPNTIARIDPASGKVVGWIDLSGISPDDQPDPNAHDYQDPRTENTLNGIAFDPASGRIFVTGKNWKKLYEIKIKPKA